MEPVVRTVLSELHEVAGDLEYVFVNPGTGTRYTETRNPLHQHAEKQEFPISRFTILRHTFGTRLADAGVDVVKIKELMGHASIVTTMRYIHATDQGNVERSQCCQSIGSGIVASLSQANSVNPFHPL